MGNDIKYQSVWQVDRRDYQKLKGDLKREIVVIGGGIAGFLTAFKLSEAGKAVTLVEADRLFSGTTGKTTAKITLNQGTVYYELNKRYGKETAALYYNAQAEGMRGIAELVKKYNIDCDWRETDSYIYSCGGKSDLDKTYEVLKNLGTNCKLESNLPNLKADIALKVSGQYLFDPIKFLTALPVNFEIFEHSRVIDVDTETKRILTESGSIKADIIIIATHFPIINSVGAYYFKLRQSTSYTIAVNKQLTKDMFLEEREDGLSIRPYSEGTLFGGFDHRTGRVVDCDAFSALKQRAKEIFGGENITHIWSAQDVMTFDKMPMAGRYSRTSEGVYLVTGFNKWGMSNSMICGGLLTDLILNRPNPYTRIFSPQRHIKGAFGDYMSNAFTNVKEIAKGYVSMTRKTVDDVPVNCGMIVRYHGKRRAVYRDENGKLFAIGRMCPHMHGELKWNPNGKCWECPCHGSRFDIYGNIISEPSTKHCKLEK